MKLLKQIPGETYDSHCEKSAELHARLLQLAEEVKTLQWSGERLLAINALELAALHFGFDVDQRVMENERRAKQAAQQN